MRQSRRCCGAARGLRGFASHKEKTCKDAEPHFITRYGLHVSKDCRPELIAFRIWSKRQLCSNPEKWYMSVEEMLEENERLSPLFYLQAHHAESLAQMLLDAAQDSRNACDASF